MIKQATRLKFKMLKNMASSLVLLGALGISGAVSMSAPVAAEPISYYKEFGTEYDASVPTPESVFGHELGELPVRHDMLVEYLRLVAEKSPRMEVETIGYSHEKRPILFITVSSPDNLSQIDDIREKHLAQLSEAAIRSGNAPKADGPVVTWLNYGVHGAEASGMDAAIPTLYHLAAAKGDAIEQQLKNSVILITAVFNPDGHARRASWVTGYASKRVDRDPQHEVHNQMWPGGRTNHYWFDLNRQWLLQTQPESRAWLTKWHEWKPHVSGDFHEMGAESTYYFHPGEPTRKFPLIPAEGRKLLKDISEYHVKALDAGKELYFSEEGFDNFYVGKGSTYPQVNGGLGILFEAGAQMGIERDSAQGVKTYARNIRTHMRTSLSTIKGAAAMRGELASYQQRFFKSALDEAKSDKVKGFVFRAPEDPARVYHFLDLLARHDIKAYPVKSEIRAGGKRFSSESFFVPADQRQYRMIRSMFDRITEFSDKIFYDVSGWTLPLLYGLDYEEVTANPRGKVAAEAAEPVMPAVAAPGEAPYAYVMRWSDYYAPRALGRLLDAGIMARVALRPMTVETKSGAIDMDAGSIIVALDRQSVDERTIHTMMNKIAETDGVPVHAAISGSTVKAGMDLGGRNFIRDLKMPNPLLIVGGGVSPYDAGEIWHQLDARMDLPVTMVRKGRLSRVNFDDYSHVLMVSGSHRGLSEATQTKLKSYVRDGGSLIAFRHAADWAAENILGYDLGKDTDENKAEAVRRSYADKPQLDAEHIIGGAVFESTLDLTHPMAFGYKRKTLASHRNTTLTLPLPKDPFAQVAVYTEAPLLSGYASDKRQDEIGGTPMLTAERLAGGSVILFADNPNFRATYLGTEKLFMNALFFSKAFDRARGRGEAAEHVEE